MGNLRMVIYALGAIAALSLAVLIIPAVGLSGDLRTYVTWIFWASFIALLVALLLPWLLDRLHIDPAFGSGPLATVIQDMLSLVIYFALAVAILA